MRLLLSRPGLVVGMPTNALATPTASDHSLARIRGRRTVLWAEGPRTDSLADQNAEVCQRRCLTWVEVIRCRAGNLSFLVLEFPAYYKSLSSSAPGSLRTERPHRETVSKLTVSLVVCGQDDRGHTRRKTYAILVSSVGCSMSGITSTHIPSRSRRIRPQRYV